MDFLNKNKIKKLEKEILFLKSELHDFISFSCNIRCEDTISIYAYLHFIYNLKSLQDDMDLYNITDDSIIRLRLDRYNSHLHFDNVSEKTFENGYVVNAGGDFEWRNDDVPFNEKLIELVRCILFQLNNMKVSEKIKKEYPRIEKLIRRNINVCKEQLK